MLERMQNQQQMFNQMPIQMMNQEQMFQQQQFRNEYERQLVMYYHQVMQPFNC